MVQWWAKQHYYARSRNKPTVTTELQLNLQEHINICCCSFNKVSIKRKTLMEENFDLTIIFDLTINFDFFCPNNSLML